MKNQSLWKRLTFALRGVRAALLGEASFQTELFLAVGAAALFAFIRPPLIWIALFALSVGMLLAFELINTALERLADRIHPEKHLSIQTAKDCAAGAVWVASLATAIVGMLTVVVGLGWLRP